MGEKMREFINKHKETLKEPLYKNSIYLMLSSVIMAGLGFFFGLSLLGFSVLVKLDWLLP